MKLLKYYGIVSMFIIFTMNKTQEIKDQTLLASLIHSECSICSEEEKIEIGMVVLNRIEDSFFPDNLQDVIYQKNQFKGILNKNNLDYSNNEYILAKNLLNGKYNSKIENALYFILRNSKQPSWTKNLNIIINKNYYHVFYK